MSASLFVGLDPSLTAFGLAAVPSDWGLDFRQVRRVTLTTKPGPLAPRRAALAADALLWVLRVAGKLGIPRTKVHVTMEGGIMNARDIKTIRSQERLAGVVEHEFLTNGRLEITIPEQQSIRSTFAGKSARGRGIGDALQALLQQACPLTASWDEAELDAFLVANWALSETGEAFISCAPPVESPKPKRSRRAA